jgi:hypothetical protein
MPYDLFSKNKETMVKINPFPHCTFDVAHLTAELQISPPQKDDIMQNEDDSDDVTGADL